MLWKICRQGSSVTKRIGSIEVWLPMSGLGVRRAKAALSSGCKPHPANAPAGSNRSSHGGNEMAEASISVSQTGDSASVQAATRVNAEQSSKRTMRRSTRQPYRGRLIRLDEMSEAIRSDAAPG